jgi:hypothetical protein
MGVSGQYHAPAALYPRGKDPPGTHCTGGWVGHRVGLDTEARGKILCPCRGSNPDRLVLQPVVKHYTDCATRLLTGSYHFKILLFYIKYVTKCSVGSGHQVSRPGGQSFLRHTAYLLLQIVATVHATLLL